MKLGSLILSVSLALVTISPARAATEKQILFTMVTLTAAQQHCPDVDFTLRGTGWALVAGLNNNDKDYINDWIVSVTQLVSAASLLPTFCDDVRSAYGPNATPVPSLPWATPEFRGMVR
jgi:hypothetical protein